MFKKYKLHFIKCKADLIKITILAFVFIFIIGTFGFEKEANAQTEIIGLVRQDCTGYNNCFTSLSQWEA
ncbi:hypothetical protein KAI92_05320, partial [Candidatus Parcubacteria bacterium]|nr:hypothetical protein [Candidatus Parcubacteria bacterium]